MRKLYQISEPEPESKAQEDCLEGDGKQDLRDSQFMNNQVQKKEVLSGVSGNDHEKGMAVGIDLGTTNSAIAVCNNITKNDITIVEINEGSYLLPSVVFVSKQNINQRENKETVESQKNQRNQEIQEYVDASKVLKDRLQFVVGKPALKEYRKNSKAGNLFYSIKRFMGKGLEDLEMLQSDIISSRLSIDVANSTNALLRFQLCDFDNGAKNVRYSLDTKHQEGSDRDIEKAVKGSKIGTGNKFSYSVTAKELSKVILQCLVDSAESFFQKKVKNAVITVPAHFDEAARLSTKTAAEELGIKVLRILNEPTAAAIAYEALKLDLDRNSIMSDSGHNIGNGSDKSLVSEEKNQDDPDDNRELDILCDEAGASQVLERLQNNSIFKGKYLVFDLGGGTFDISILEMQFGVLKVIATAGDNRLGGDDFDLVIDEIAQKKIIDKEISNKEFNSCNISESRDGESNFDDKKKGDEDKGSSDVNSFISVARAIKEHLTDKSLWFGFYGGHRIEITRDEFETSAKSLILRINNILESALNDSNIEASEINSIILVGGATRMPLVRDYIKQKFQHLFDNMLRISQMLNPDFAVVKGAAIQALSLTSISDHLLLDVTPLSLGIELMGGVVEHIIHRNSPIPISVKKRYTTQVDNQRGFKLHLLQGESERVEKCRSLAKIELQDISPMPAGHAILEVTFTMDVDGLLTVSAVEIVSNKGVRVEVRPSYGLDEEGIVNLMHD